METENVGPYINNRDRAWAREDVGKLLGTVKADLERNP